MNIILIPTDFSENAIHAATYAAQLGELSKSKFVFLHVYETPIVDETSFSNEFGSLIADLKMNAEEAMENFVIEFRSKNNLPLNQIQKIIELGIATTKIIEVAENIKPDSIVMGTKGASNAIEKWIGTTTQYVMNHANCPTWIIPENAEIKKPEEVLYAADFKENEISATHKFVDIAHKIGAKSRVLHVHEYFEPNVGHVVEEISKELKHEFEGDDVSINHITRENVISGLEKYIETHKPDILALAIHEKSIFEKIFAKSVSDYFVFKAQLPLLIFRK